MDNDDPPASASSFVIDGDYYSDRGEEGLLEAKKPLLIMSSSSSAAAAAAAAAAKESALEKSTLVENTALQETRVHMLDYIREKANDTAVELKKQQNDIEAATPHAAIIAAALGVVEKYMAEHGAVLFGGTAFRLIARMIDNNRDRGVMEWPPTREGILEEHRQQFGIRYDDFLEYQQEQYLNDKVDYDIYLPNSRYHASKLCELLHDKGFPSVEGREGIHEGTLKIFVDFEAVVDMHDFPDDLYDKLKDEAFKHVFVAPDGTESTVMVASPNWLRLELYKELSEPQGNVDRWGKLLPRLVILNRYFTLNNALKTDASPQQQQNGDKCAKVTLAVSSSWIDDFQSVLKSSTRVVLGVVTGLLDRVALFISEKRLILVGMTAMSTFINANRRYEDSKRNDKTYSTNVVSLRDASEYDTIYTPSVYGGGSGSGESKALSSLCGELVSRLSGEYFDSVIADAADSGIELTDVHVARLKRELVFRVKQYGVIPDILMEHQTVYVHHKPTGFKKVLIDIYVDPNCVGYVDASATLAKTGKTIPFRIAALPTMMKMYFVWMFLESPGSSSDIVNSGHKEYLSNTAAAKVRREHAQQKIICAIEYLLLHQTYLHEQGVPIMSVFATQCDRGAATSGAGSFIKKIEEYKQRAHKWRWLPPASRRHRQQYKKKRQFKQ